jgi:hypothetical protein
MRIVTRVQTHDGKEHVSTDQAKMALLNKACEAFDQFLSNREVRGNGLGLESTRARKQVVDGAFQDLDDVRALVAALKPIADDAILIPAEPFEVEAFEGGLGGGVTNAI